MTQVPQFWYLHTLYKHRDTLRKNSPHEMVLGAVAQSGREIGREAVHSELSPPGGKFPSIHAPREEESEGESGGDGIQARASRTRRANTFMVIFLIYPKTCAHSFGLFNCRQLSATEHFLVDNYSINCSSSTHHIFQWIAGFVVVFFACGYVCPTVAR